MDSGPAPNDASRNDDGGSHRLHHERGASVPAYHEAPPGVGPVSIARRCDNRPSGGRFLAHRSVGLTIFWHCGHSPFSSRTALARASRQRTVNGFRRGFQRLARDQQKWTPVLRPIARQIDPGSGNADSQRKVRSSGWSGRCRPCASGCVDAHPASWRASASYRPLRAVWAVCAWALRGCARPKRTPSALRQKAAHQLQGIQP